MSSLRLFADPIPWRELPRWRKALAFGALIPFGMVLYAYIFGVVAGNLSASMKANAYLLLDPFPRWKGMAIGFDAPKGFDPRAPFVKRIVGLPGDVIAHDGRNVLLNGEPVAFAKAFTEGGDRLDMIAPGVIPEGFYFALGDAPESFDSRFAWVGLISETRVIGTGFALPFAPSARPADYQPDHENEERVHGAE